MASNRLRRIALEVVAALAATLLGLAGFELALRGAYALRNAAIDAIPLPYVAGHDYGPQPPWVDGLRILVPDEDLIWRASPGVSRRYIDVFSPVDRDQDRYGLIRQFLPRVPPSLESNPVWEITLNSQGFREVELPQGKPSGSFRIVCLGDSWTFGANVGPDEAYPRRLEALLRAEYPGRSFEVLNLGVLGYTSFQGLRLLEQVGRSLEPDLVLLGYGMNDGDVAGYRDKDMIGYPKPEGLGHAVRAAATGTEIYKLLNYLAMLVHYEPSTLGDHLRAKAKKEPGAESEADYAELEEWTRVSPADYGANMTAMVERAGDLDAGVILLFNELWPESPYRKVLGRVAAARGVPLIDSSRLVAEARRRIEEEREVDLGLEPPASPPRAEDGKVEVVFRVDFGDRPVPTAAYIVGAHPDLGNLAPNTLAMHDDGTRGDQRAGDRVWSHAARFEPGTRLAYVYTNSGVRGEWTGLDVPYVRQFTVASPDSVGRVYRPIETFGAITMLADTWHTNAAGYDLIAAAVLDSLRQEPRFAAFVSD